MGLGMVLFEEYVISGKGCGRERVESGIRFIKYILKFKRTTISLSISYDCRFIKDEPLKLTLQYHPPFIPLLIYAISTRQDYPSTLNNVITSIRIIINVTNVFIV
jgi:hypothetical protein